METKIWSGKIEVIEKMQEVLRCLKPGLLPSGGQLKKLISYITLYMQDSHYKVVLKANDCIQDLLSLFDTRTT
jgi:hypothetical protein